jgi:malonyl-CoA O-methyltransferase
MTEPLLTTDYLPATGVAQAELVLLHGWGNDRSVWHPLVVQLRSWANVTLIDLPGVAPGYPAYGDGSREALHDAILAVSPQRAVYLGWSLGGQLATEIAAFHPQRTAALATLCSNPSFSAVGDWPGLPAATLQAFSDGFAHDCDVTLNRFFTLQVLGSKSARETLRGLRGIDAMGDISSLGLGLDWLVSIDNRDLLATLTVPQLHILAENDALVPDELAQALTSELQGMSDARVERLPESSHLAPVEAPELIASDVRRFLGAVGELQTGEVMADEVQKQDIAVSFSRSAQHYDSVAQLQRDVGQGLLSVLDDVRIAPRRVLDLGCGTGYFRAALQDRFSDAHYVGVDLAEGMIRFARDACVKPADWLVGDAEALPLASNSVDVVFSSLAIQWCYQPQLLFAELHRVLRPGGCCVFSTLGPGTLHELRDAWSLVDNHRHVNRFLPVAQLQAASAMPGVQLALNQQSFEMHYDRVADLLRELKTLGAHNMNRGRPTGLTGRRRLLNMFEAYEAYRNESGLPATYDVIYGVLKKHG